MRWTPRRRAVPVKLYTLRIRVRSLFSLILPSHLRRASAGRDTPSGQRLLPVSVTLTEVGLGRGLGARGAGGVYRLYTYSCTAVRV